MRIVENLDCNIWILHFETYAFVYSSLRYVSILVTFCQGYVINVMSMITYLV